MAQENQLPDREYGQNVRTHEGKERDDPWRVSLNRLIFSLGPNMHDAVDSLNIEWPEKYKAKRSRNGDVTFYDKNDINVFSWEAPEESDTRPIPCVDSNEEKDEDEGEEEGEESDEEGAFDDSVSVGAPDAKQPRLSMCPWVRSAPGTD